jgi:hypothetical protein
MMGDFPEELELKKVDEEIALLAQRGNNGN